MAHDIAAELNAIASAPDFAERTDALIEQWAAAGVGLEAIDPILRFMESHPGIDFGGPGALVHFVERFHRKGYEPKLFDSFSRTPTAHTAWMLNRLINGAKTAEEQQHLIALMKQARAHPLADENAIRQVGEFLEDLE